MDSKSVATVLLAAFVIDRIIAALMYVGATVSLPRATDEKAIAIRKEHGRKFVYFVLSAVLCYIVVRMMKTDEFSFGGIAAPLNPLILWIIMVGGANRISEFIGKNEAPAPVPLKARTSELHVVGTLSLDRESAERVANAAGGR
jgi:hypothetical protein